MSQKITVFIKVIWFYQISFETISYFLEQSVFWTTNHSQILYLLLFAISLNGDPPSLYLVLEWAFGIYDFFLTDLVLNYSDQYLFVYVGIFSGAVYFLSDFLLEIVHLLVGILLNPLLPKKARAHDSTFFLDLFQFADKCFRSNHRTWDSLIYRKFTSKIDGNVEMTL